MVSVATTVLSVVAVIIYSVDINKNPEEICIKSPHARCNDKYYAVVGIMSCHSIALNHVCLVGGAGVLFQWKC